MNTRHIPDVGEARAPLIPDERMLARVTTDETLTGAPLLRALRDAVGRLHRAGDLDRASRLLDETVTSRGIQLHEPTPLAACVHRLVGITRRLSGRPIEAVDALTKAKVYAEILHDDLALARATSALGNAYGQLANWTIARRCYEEAIRIARSMGHRALEWTARQNLVVALTHEGRLIEALAVLREDAARDHSCDEGGRHRAVSRAVATGVVLRRLGRPRFARRAAERALSAARANRFTQAEAMAEGLLGEIAVDRSETGRALGHLKRKLRIALEVAPTGPLACEAYRAIAEAKLAAGDEAGTKRALAEARRLASPLADDVERVAILRATGRLAARAGDEGAARTAFREAIALAQQRGLVLEAAATLEAAARALSEAGAALGGARMLADARAAYERLGLGGAVRRLDRVRPARRRRPAGVRERFGIQTRCPRVLEILETIERLAPTPIPVLVTGESGVGKELVARALHTASGRGGRLVDVNCPAIPDSMLECELFGSRRGAFTGAEDRTGLVAGADGGTLFLDEIADMPKSLMAKLLRFLETSGYRRLGSPNKEVVEVRVVSATNARLSEAVESGAFRSDLFHRLAGVVIEMPPLRERVSDVSLLARSFLSEFAREAGREPPVLSSEAEAALEAYRWPGNVRELRHLARSLVYGVRSETIAHADLPPAIGDEGVAEGGGERHGSRAIRRAITKSGGNVARAARALGMSRQRLYRRAAALGVDLVRAREATRASS